MTIDTAKGLGIVLVVFGHSWFMGDNRLMSGNKLYTVIFSFHMPLFFFLSGIFLKKEASMRGFVAKRFASLLKPYFLVLAIFGVLELSTSVISQNRFDIYEYLFGVMWGTGETIHWGWRSLWFLTHLFSTLIFSLAVIKLVSWLRQDDTVILAISALLLIGGAYAISACDSPNPIIIDVINST